MKSFAQCSKEAIHAALEMKKGGWYQSTNYQVLGKGALRLLGSARAGVTSCPTR